MGRATSRRGFLKGGVGAALSIGALGAIGCGSGDGGGAATAAAGAVPTVKPKPDGDITWFTWSEYVDPKIVKAFEKEYGVRVKQTFFDSDEAMVQKVATGLPYDLITTNSAYIERMVQGDLLQTFDFSQLKNAGELDAFFEAPSYDKGEHRYSIPYGYSAAGIAYRKDKVGDIPASWDALWETPQAAKHIYILDQIEETLGISLVRNGDDALTSDPAKVQKAADEVIKLKPQLGGISTDSINDLANGSAWLCHTWAGTAYQGFLQAKNADQFGFVMPKEGVLIGSDCLSIGAKAKAPGTALLFMDWILRPENSATNTKYQGQLTGTKASTEAYAEITKDFPFLQTGEQLLTDGIWKQSLTGLRAQVWNQQWSRIKAA
jgi:spermidine/putrescine transport system substrate-binding protein